MIELGGAMQLEYTCKERIFGGYGWLNVVHSNHHDTQSTLGDLKNVPHSTLEDSLH